MDSKVEIEDELGNVFGQVADTEQLEKLIEEFAEESDEDS